jgi:uncharacterized protein (TIGR02265 family)
MESKKQTELMMIGFLTDNDRDKIKREKPERLEEFDRLAGWRKLSPVTFYPIEATLKYQKVAAQILYGNEDPESFYKLGVWDYHYVLDSQLGKAVKALFMKNPKQAAMGLPALVSAATRGFNVKVSDISEKEIEIVFDNDPYPQTYFQGMFEEALRYTFTVNGRVTVVNLPDGKRKFIVRWD